MLSENSSKIVDACGLQDAIVNAYLRTNDLPGSYEKKRLTYVTHNYVVEEAVSQPNSHNHRVSGLETDIEGSQSRIGWGEIALHFRLLWRCANLRDNLVPDAGQNEQMR